MLHQYYLHHHTQKYTQTYVMDSSLFQEIKKDNTSVQCKMDECFAEIYTTHFTKFIVSASDPITNIDLLLTVSAPLDTTRKTVELRVALHECCPKLQGFMKQRAEVRNLGFQPQTFNCPSCSRDENVIFENNQCDVHVSFKWKHKETQKAYQERYLLCYPLSLKLMSV